MNRSLLPPGITEEVYAASTLVIAPHFDDEVLGCGGLIAKLVRAGSVVRVLFLSDSSGGMEEVDVPETYASIRRREAKEAARVLGLTGIDELGLPDGVLEQHLEPMIEGIRRALLSQQPDLLLVTSPLEATSDHRAAFYAVHRLLGSYRDTAPAPYLPKNITTLRILAYEVNHPLYPDLLVDVSEQSSILEEAMACYRSQQTRHDYLAARLGLSRYRALSLPPEIEAVEAYRRLELADFTTRGPARLIAELGGAPQLLAVKEGPKISVIVRTKDRPKLLMEALESLSTGTYRRAEVLVINDGGQSPTLPETFPLELRLVNLDSNQGRAAAANAGVAAAGGAYVTFLDDDDLAEPEHLAILARLVQAAGVRVAYTDAAVGIYELDGTDGWQCRERRLPYSRDFDPELLLVDNYIPFNTLLIERRLFDEVGEFDSGLPFFEDWDFLIRLSAITDFHHLTEVTCEYRHFRRAGHHILGDDPRGRSDFLAMKARVIARYADRLSPEAIARIVDLQRTEAVVAGEETARLRLDVRELEDRYHRLNGRLSGLEAHARVLEETERRMAEELRRSRVELVGRERELAERDQQLARSYRDVEERDRLCAEQQDELARKDQILAERVAEVERLFERERQLEAELHDQAEHTRRTYAEIERMNDLIRTMESTRLWRLHGWLERMRS